MIRIPLQDRTVPAVLASSQARGGQRPFLVAPGERYSHAQAEEIIASLAGALAGRGIRRGTRVALLVERSVRTVLVLLALARLGAVAVVLNTDAKGKVLTYYLEDSASEFGLVDDRHGATFAQAAAQAGGPPAIHLHAGGQWIGRIGPGSPRLADGTVEFWEPFVVLYTSGTTGMPKGVPISHAHAITCGAIWADFMGFGVEDRLYTCLPFFHINATAYSLCGALVSGASLAVGPHFSATSFWADVAELRATQINGMGSMLKILQSREPVAGERSHGARTMFIAPMPPDAADLSRRFGLHFSTTYGQTEWIPSSLTKPGEGYDRPGGTGPILPYSELQIVGQHDEPVTPGTKGEITLRSREPYTTFTSYLGKPKETVEAFRNLRFHTGDLGEVSEDGWLYFRGRAGDVIRRRGENISPQVVEESLCAHSDIAEVAAVAVPSELMEDDVFVYVMLREGTEMSPEQLITYAREVLPRYMVPRYAQFIADLPRTATNKVAKALLKEQATNDLRAGRVRELS